MIASLYGGFIIMKKLIFIFVSLSVVLTACGPAATATVPAPTGTPTASASATPLPPTLTPSPEPSPTPLYPSEGYGPSNFSSNVDPLTGLQVADPALLVRRPLLIKVSNLPRSIRPQWGLSLADIVFEYYTEEGATRFAAVFYGNDAEMVGPIRSGRFIDSHLIRGYKAVFAFGSAYIYEMNRFLQSEYANRLVIEGPNSPLFRYDPNGMNNLMANTTTLSAFITAKGVENGRQNLDGMSFNLSAPAGGQPGFQVAVRYSGVIYNRWAYDPSTGKYLRFSDIQNDYNNQNEQYGQLTDRLTNQPIAFDNLVILYVPHELFSPGIYDILLSGTGEGYAFRDGQSYQVKWQRNDTDVVSLTNLDGTPFPFKSGTTWFEVVGTNSQVQQADQSWRFIHKMP
jgi:hypothetical protein